MSLISLLSLLGNAAERPDQQVELAGMDSGS
jgi:hypothetical protein